MELSPGPPTMNIRRISECSILFALLILAPLARAADEQEKELLAVLRSEAPKAEKAIACKRLAIHGSSTAVDELAKLLPDPELHSWARIALEAIPGAEANEAFRAAA